jgi:hypothetical protein
MTLKKVGRFLIWVAAQSINYILVYQGLHEHHPMAFNVFKFLCWVFIALYMLGLVAEANDPTMQGRLIKNRSVPGWLSVVSDLGIAIFLAAYGHWFYAGLVMFQQSLEIALFAEPLVKTNDKGGSND